MIENKFLKIFEKNFKIEKKLKVQLLKNKKNIKLNSFRDWDSMKHVAILSEIEKTFKIKFNDKNLSFFNDFQSGIRYIKNYKK
tara:strand:- start:543 stop:791 length:249 start_codon:yes stop_codon:yes gene_type:complete